MKNRKGIIKIQINTIDEFAEELLYVFSKFIPIYIENNPINNGVMTYYGYSPKFREVKEGEATPEYDVIVTRNEDEDINVEFNEISIEPTNNNIMNAMLNQVKEKHGTH